jgi:hypothetical protein
MRTEVSTPKGKSGVLLFVGFGQFAPLAIADVVDDQCRAMPSIQWAMLGWRFGFVMGGAAASFGFFCSIDLHQQRLTTVRDALINPSQMTSFAKLGALRPVGFPPHDSKPPQPCRCRLGGGLAQNGEGVVTASKSAHGYTGYRT